jgi:hypothetical protein
MVAVCAITIWAKFSKRDSPHFLFIFLAATEFMEVSFAVSINEKLVPFASVRGGIMCAVKRT